MDALWDSLRGGFEEETTIVLKGASAWPQDMRYSLPVLVGVFEDLKKAGDIKDFVLINDTDGETLSDYLI